MIGPAAVERANMRVGAKRLERPRRTVDSKRPQPPLEIPPFGRAHGFINSGVGFGAAFWYSFAACLRMHKDHVAGCRMRS